MRKFLSLFLALAMSIACCTLAAAEDTAEAMQYTEENITIDAGDHQIPATLTVPAVSYTHLTLPTTSRV